MQFSWGGGMVWSMYIRFICDPFYNTVRYVYIELHIVIKFIIIL